MRAPWRVAALTLVSAMSLLLGGCASPPAATDLALNGRMALRVEGQPERSFSASFELSGGPRQGRLLLSGPLGTTAALAEWAPGEAFLSANGSRERYGDLDALAGAALGEPVPIAALFDWLRGQPFVGAPSAARVDGISGFAQLGWRIDLSRWAEGWIEAQRDAPPVVTVRARMER